MPEQPSSDKSAWVAVARYSEIGFIVPCAVVVGFVIGKLLDGWLGTHWIVVAGVCVGAIAGFVQMVRMLLSSTRDRDGS